MIREDTLIPYLTSPLPESPWIVFAPHPDDETFGMGGTLLLAQKKGYKVTLVILTDGSLGGKKTGSGEIVNIREKEVLQVSNRLCISDVFFWRQPDRELKASKEIIARVAKLVDKLKPASVFFPSPMELHPDHRTASLLVWEGLRLCPSFSGLAYAYEISVQCPANRLIDITAVANEKRDLATLYRSQLKERDYPSAMLALNRTRSYTLPGKVIFAEAFFSYGKIGGVLDLFLHDMDHFLLYWCDRSLCQEQFENQGKLNQMLMSVQNVMEKRFNGCKLLEDRFIWCYVKLFRMTATTIKFCARCIDYIGNRYKRNS